MLENLLKLKAVQRDRELLMRATTCLQNWQEQQEAINNTKFTIVISGQQNSGKSTLGNALLQCFGKEKFKTSDCICTKKSQAELGQDNMLYIDTPGYGTSDDNDEEECRKSWRKADIVLFLHSVLLGGADQREEVAMLQDLSEIIPDPSERILLLCTKCGERSKSEVQLIRNEFSRKINEILGTKLKCLAIDSLDYIDSMQIPEPDVKLAQLSNVEQVRKWISEHSHMSSTRSMMLTKEKDVMISLISDINNKIQQEQNKINENKQLYENNLKNIWASYSSDIKAAWQDCKTKKMAWNSPSHRRR